MNETHSLIAFIGLVLAICYLATIAAVLAFHGKYAEALGFGGITTGLVGVLGTFRPRNSAMVGPNENVSVQPAEGGK